ncbi:MAG: hypothetical protein P8J61_10455 [Gammaproteobacteria bacterium]|nr:hypothetical protein [Gammaproteobacteria bacterium]
MRIYEAAYFSSEYGTLGVDEWQRFEKQACRFKINLPSDIWTRVALVLSDQFDNYLVDNCE